MGTGEGRKGRGGNGRGGWRGRTCESCRRTQPRRLAWSSPGRSPVSTRRGARAGQTRIARRGWKAAVRHSLGSDAHSSPAVFLPCFPSRPCPPSRRHPWSCRRVSYPPAFSRWSYPSSRSVRATSMPAAARILLPTMRGETQPSSRVAATRGFPESRRYFCSKGRQKTSRGLLVTSRAASTVVSPRPLHTRG